MTIIFFDGTTRKANIIEVGFDQRTKRYSVIVDETDVYDITVILRIIKEA